MGGFKPPEAIVTRSGNELEMSRRRGVWGGRAPQGAGGAGPPQRGLGEAACHERPRSNVKVPYIRGRKKHKLNLYFSRLRPLTFQVDCFSLLFANS